MSEQTKIVAVLIIFLLLLLAGGMMWGGGMMGGMMGHGMMGWNPTAMPWWWALAFIFRVAVIAGLVLVAVWAFRHFGQPKTEESRQPLDILKARYASGALTREQYEQMRRELE